MKNKKVIYAVLVVIGLTALWFIVFNVRSSQIDDEVASMTHVSELTDDYSNGKTISDVKAVIKGVNIKLVDLNTVNELPTTLEVVVTYDDNTTEEKSAYISYSDVIEPEYIDNEYGRILLPDSWFKE